MYFLVDLIDLCSTNSGLAFTRDELVELAGSGGAGAVEVATPPYRIGPRLGPDRRADVIRRYEAGETAQSLADEFEVSKTALLELLRRSNVVVRRRSLTDEQVADLAREYGAGKTIATLEAETGIPHGTIQRALKLAGVQMRPRGFQPGR